MPVRRCLAAIVVALTVSGCGSSPADAVRAKVQQFADAARHHDYRTLCDQVLAPELVQRLVSAGLTCEQAMQAGLGSVRNPQVSIGKITVRATYASVLVLSVANGQRGSLDDLQLTRTSAGWRIVSLSGPGGSAGAGSAGSSG